MSIDNSRRQEHRRHKKESEGTFRGGAETCHSQPKVVGGKEVINGLSQKQAAKLVERGKAYWQSAGNRIFLVRMPKGVTVN